jgi:hypothetical protein
VAERSGAPRSGLTETAAAAWPGEPQRSEALREIEQTVELMKRRALWHERLRCLLAEIMIGGAAGLALILLIEF